MDNRAVHATTFRVSDNKRVVALPYDARLAGLIPHSKVLTRNGRDYMIVPHRNTETRLLNNLGYEIPSPILHQYDWSGVTPFESQRVTAAMMVANKRSYVLSAMGTGKTMSALFAIDFLKQQGEIRRALIIAPLSTLTAVWEREIFRYFPHLSCITLHGSASKRKLMLEEDRDIYIINHDGLNVIEDELIAKKDIDFVIIDELAVLRNSKTTRWKVTSKVIKGKTFVHGMTGSPTPKAPTDAYGQVKLLTPERVPKYYKAFQSEVMIQLTQFKWIAKHDANDKVNKIMQPSVRYELDDCVDIPDTTYSTRAVEMTKEQAKAYQQMRTEYVAQLADGIITAANAGVKASKLVQIASGFSYDSLGETHDLDASPRLKVLKEVIDGADKKVLVFAPFRHSVEWLTEELSKDYTVAMIHGGVGKTQRDTILANFQFQDDPVVLVAHPGCLAHGVTLTAANVTVWYAPLWDLELYDQANARTPRPGQTHHTHIVHLQGSPVEKRIYKVLEERGDMMRSLLDLFHEQT